MGRIGSPAATAALVAGVLVAGAAATPGPRAQMMVQAPPPGKYEILSGARTVSFPFEVSMNWILVPVRVNGSGPFHLILDTGMPVNGAILFDGPEAQALGLGDAAAGKGCGAAVSAEGPATTLDLPGLRLTNETVAVMPPPGKPGTKLPAADGVIGLSLFGPFAVRIDYDAMIITLTEADAFSPAAGLAPTPFSGDPDPMVEIECAVEQADGRVVPAVLVVDTGASHAASLNVEPGSALTLPTKTIEVSLGQTYAGERLGRVGRIESLRIGGAVLRNVVASFPSSPLEGMGAVEKDGNLGNGLLRRFNTTFDFARNRMFLEPNSRFNDLFEYDMTGMQFVRTQDGPLEVTRVVPGSPADEAGIAAGDVILAVDGTPAGDQDGDDLFGWLREEGRVMTLRLAREGTEREVTLALRRLI
jgi:hypothetical protein